MGFDAGTSQTSDRSGRRMKLTLPKTIFFSSTGVYTILERMEAVKTTLNSSAVEVKPAVRHIQSNTAIHARAEGKKLTEEKVGT